MREADRNNRYIAGGIGLRRICTEPGFRDITPQLADATGDCKERSQWREILAASMAETNVTMTKCPGLTFLHTDYFYMRTSTPLLL